MHPCNNFVCNMISWTDTHVTDVHVTCNNVTMQLCNYHHDETQICHIDLCDDFVCDIIWWVDSYVIVTLVHGICYMHPCNNFVCDMISWTDTHITDVHNNFINLWPCLDETQKCVTYIHVTISYVTWSADQIYILQRLFGMHYMTTCKCNYATP